MDFSYFRYWCSGMTRGCSGLSDATGRGFLNCCPWGDVTRNTSNCLRKMRCSRDSISWRKWHTLPWTNSQFFGLGDTNISCERVGSGGDSRTCKWVECGAIWSWNIGCRGRYLVKRRFFLYSFWILLWNSLSSEISVGKLVARCLRLICLHFENAICLMPWLLTMKISHMGNDHVWIRFIGLSLNESIYLQEEIIVSSLAMISLTIWMLPIRNSFDPITW